MNSFLGLENIPADVESRPGPESPQPPRLLLELEPWGRGFRRNLTDFLLRRRPPAVAISSTPASFWPDVFVTQRLPWVAFAESILYHGIFFALAWEFSAFLASRPQVAQVRRFDPADVIYYSPSEYLPPLDTGASQVAKPLRGDPEFAKQPILSVPPESDNRHQTIVSAPDIKLSHDVETPNIVAWGDHTVPVPGAAIERTPSQLPALPNQIVAPVPEVNQASNAKLQSLSQSIVAPPPELKDEVHAVASLSIDVIAPAPDAQAAATSRTLRGPQSAVVEPPPAINAASIRKMGDINIGHSEVVAPAPQLPVEAQRTLSTLASDGPVVVPPPPSVGGTGADTVRGRARGTRTQAGLDGSSGQVVPPPPSIPSVHSAAAGGRIIALGIHPSVAPPEEPPQGNRRGTFAATPEGRPGAAGSPDIRPNSTAGNDRHGMSTDDVYSGAGSGSRNGAAAGAPPGLHVGAPAKPPSSAQAGGDPSNGATGGVSGTIGKGEIASLSEPHTRPGTISGPRPKAELVDNPSPLERQIFHDRRLYSMTLNMPNLNSAGGSWVMRFAELDSNREKGELIAPVAEHKVDPAYPMQLMRENVSGTVTLRAIIRTDGTVSDIQVVNGADARLDHYASQALARWHFRPALKNDATVDVEAIVMIPFKPILRRSTF
jgi:TonB family protein